MKTSTKKSSKTRTTKKDRLLKTKKSSKTRTTKKDRLLKTKKSSTKNTPKKARTTKKDRLLKTKKSSKQSQSQSQLIKKQTAEEKESSYKFKFKSEEYYLPNKHPNLFIQPTFNSVYLGEHLITRGSRDTVEITGIDLNRKIIIAYTKNRTPHFIKPSNIQEYRCPLRPGNNHNLWYVDRDQVEKYKNSMPKAIVIRNTSEISLGGLYSLRKVASQYLGEQVIVLRIGYKKCTDAILVKIIGQDTRLIVTYDQLIEIPNIKREN